MANEQPTTEDFIARFERLMDSPAGRIATAEFFKQEAERAREENERRAAGIKPRPLPRPGWRCESARFRTLFMGVSNGR